jgi:hypothetical protein
MRTPVPARLLLLAIISLIAGPEPSSSSPAVPSACP